MSSLADRLNRARAGRFVGRAAELDLFRSVLRAEDLPFAVIHIHGPGGIGKSTLLREYGRLAAEEGAPAVYLDTQTFEPTPEAFHTALALHLGTAPGTDPVANFAQRPRPQVLLLDTYEAALPLDHWLRDSFFPQLPADALVVIAGRFPPQPAWRSDPGWQSLLRIVALRNLSPEESLDYLDRREFPSEQRGSVVQFTHGHPLALSLVADSHSNRAEGVFQPEESPDLIKSLLERFVQNVPGPGHRAALEASAMVRMLNEALLAHLLALPEAHEIFEWLRGLSFIESTPLGLMPHSLAREAIASDLRWRNRERFAELHRRAREYYGQRLQETTGLEQQIVLYDYIYLHRDNPVVKPAFEFKTASALRSETARTEDAPQLRALVERHEGAESAGWFDFWFERQPERFLVVRDGTETPAGFLALIALSHADPADLRRDPATHAAWSYLERTTPLREGECATHFRFWMSRDDYQQVGPVQSHIVVAMVQHYFVTPGLAFTFVATADPDFWDPAFSYADIARIPATDFQVGGRHYGVAGHDWRKVPPLAWLALLGERELGAPAAEEATLPPTETLLVLSQDEFEAAVREALKVYTKPDLLKQNPLLRTRLVQERAGATSGKAERADALRALFKEIAQAMKGSPKDLKLLRPVHYTYLAPLDTQELAADRLGLPFSTYRRHLAAGMKRIADLLWQQEIGD
ncbi:MAG: ATP-binding protein [Candidatus Eisenbacteria bacterium]|nr:ATP-binding protein [Candidatus Eisenbacteria bacterium]MCC7143678.1 ATP-binding protein [Candidatus Eisenbacteria bacterium]